MNHNRPFDNRHMFKEIDTESKAYWLGFLSADGWVSAKENDYKIELTLAKKDRGHLEKFKGFIGLENEIRDRVVANKYYSSRFSFRSPEMKNDLIAAGCTPQKTFTLKFPTENIVPTELMRHYVRGYLDGDGWISYTGKSRQVGFIGTEDFLMALIEKFNLPNLKLYSVHNGPQKRYMFSGKNSKEFITLLYNDSNVYLDRKYQAYLNYINDVPFRQR